jgi:microcystin-dependent protein
MAIDYPNSPSTGDHHTHDGKTWTFHDGKWALNVSAEGVRGPAGVAFQGTAPTATDVLWADTSVSGVAVVPTGGTTGQVLAKSSSASYDTAWATPVTSSDLALKAPLASPALTGTPTAPTATAATNTTQIATTAFVRGEVTALVNSATATLDTLGEIATALGNDANLSTTLTTAIGLKAPLASPALTGTPTAPTASAGTNTTQIATTEFVQVASPTGAVIAFAGSSAPTNWLLCYGQAVSRTTYAALFAVVSTTYGVGDGTTTFNLPDLRGRTVAGVDNMGGSDAGRLDIANSSGTVVGSQYVTLTSAEMPSHTHTQDSHNHTQDSHNHTQNSHGHNFNDPGFIPGVTNIGVGGGGTGFYGRTPTQGLFIGDATATNQNESAHTHSVTSNVTISNVNNTAANAASAHDNMSPYLGVNFIIKAL